jgi:endonuclease/exonuclease/phosphatase family metal-dependent hydrolase
MQTLKVLSMNTWGITTLLPERMELLIAGLLSRTPDVVCLQEVFAPAARTAIASGLAKHYYILSANHDSLHYPTLAYIPSAMILVIVSLFMHMSSAGASVWCLLLLSAIFLPQVLCKLITSYIRYKTSSRPSISALDHAHAPKCDTFDFLATCVLVRKEHCGSLELVASTPFSFTQRAYPLNMQKPWTWWFQMSYLRPGFLIGRCTCKDDPSKTLLLVVNVHLVVGVTNIGRTGQVRCVLAAVEEAKRQYDCQRVVWCGDFNAHHTQPEISVMGQHGLADAAQLEDDVDHDRLYTWHNEQNPFVQPGEPNARMDYVFYCRRSFAVVHYERCFDRPPFVSDHFGVLAHLTIK